MKAAAKKDVFKRNTIHYVEFGNPDSKDVVLFLHGMGERAYKREGGRDRPINDGSMLSRVVKLGWPKEADNGFKFPFNLLVPQVTISYSLQLKFFSEWAKTKYPTGKLWIAGISLGGAATQSALKSPGKELIDGIISCCGKTSTLKLEETKAVKGQAYHGTADKEVPYSVDLKFVNAYNEYHSKNNTGGHIEFIPIHGAGHDIWNKVFSVKPGEDQALQFVVNNLKN